MYYNNYNYDFAEKKEQAGSNVKPQQYAKMQTSKLKGELNGYKAGVRAALGRKNDSTELNGAYQSGLTSGRPIVGGLGGSLLGAGIGALAGNALGNTGLGAGIGALGGAALGAGAGLTFNHGANTPTYSGKAIGMAPRKAIGIGADVIQKPVQPMVVTSALGEGVQVGRAHAGNGLDVSSPMMVAKANDDDYRKLFLDPEYIASQSTSAPFINHSQQVNNLLALKRLARLSGKQDFSSINDLSYRLYMFY